MNTERLLPRNMLPGILPRGVAKAIDFVAVGFTVVGFSRLTHSYLAGLLIGYGWLAFSDSFGSLGKAAMKLKVLEPGTGRECSARASFLRNLPIIAVVLPLKLHQALLGMDRQEYRAAHLGIILTMACLCLILMTAILVMITRSPGRRHLGDLLAGTIVVSRNTVFVSGKPRNDSSIPSPPGSTRTENSNGKPDLNAGPGEATAE